MKIQVPRHRVAVEQTANEPGAPDAMLDPEAVTQVRTNDDDAAVPHIGIVCVHGIGFQEPGVTLLEWSGAISTALVAWRTRHADSDFDSNEAKWPRDLIETSDVDLSGANPSYVTFQIPGLSAVPGSTAQRWTFTEAYWAAKVESPTLRLVTDWTGREGITSRVVDGILRRTAKGRFQAVVRAAGVLWLGVFVSALTSLVLLTWVALRSLLALVPIKAIQDVVSFGAGERFLVGWWGDARSLVRDPVQAGTVRTALDEAIKNLRLEQKCERIVVIAHSGGTIAAYMTLSDPALSASADLLVTHGQAISLGRRLEALESDSDVSGQVQPSVTRIAQVRDPDHLKVARWHDFYGTHDPAPISTPSDMTVQTADSRFATEIVNLSSIRGDHGGYWTNDEQFVLPVLSEIERVGGSPTSRFTQVAPATDPPPPDARLSDEVGVERRLGRVVMRSLWGRLALAGPVVAILLAAGIAGGNIDDAAVLDIPSDVLAAVYDHLPFSAEIREIRDVVATTIGPDLQQAATSASSVVLFLLFAIAAGWGSLWVGGWSRMPRGGVLADILISLSIPIAAVIAVVGPGRILGIGGRWEFWLVAIIALAILVISTIVHQLYKHGWIRGIPSGWLSIIILVVLAIGVAALVLSVITHPATLRWFIDAAFAAVAVRAIVRIGMWRWDAWDASERQWFRGPRQRIPSRTAVHLIAIALGALVVSVVAMLGGLVGVGVGAGLTWLAWLPFATFVFGGLFLIGLVVRDASITESVR